MNNSAAAVPPPPVIKITAIVPLCPPTSTAAEAKAGAIELFSTLFTVRWGKNQEKIELRRFGTPAEECLRRTSEHSRKWNRLLAEFVIYTALALLGLYFYQTVWITTLAWTGATLFLIRIIVGFREICRSRPGKTFFQVADAWEKSRSLLKKLGVLEKLAGHIEYAPQRIENFGLANSKLVVQAEQLLFTAMKDAGRELGKAESEQDEPARRRLRALYEQAFALAKFYSALPVNTKFGDYLPARSNPDKEEEKDK